jgi:hypothetical protein
MTDVAGTGRREGAMTEQALDTPRVSLRARVRSQPTIESVESHEAQPRRRT